MAPTTRLAPPHAARRRAAALGFTGSKMDLLAAGADAYAIGYDRASSDPRDTRSSVRDQRTHRRNVIERHGWTLFGEWCDNNKSGSRESGVTRTDFEAMCEAIRTSAGRIHVLVMLHVSREGRDLGLYVELRDLCTRSGVNFWHVGGQLYDLRNPSDLMMLGMEAVRAEVDRKQIIANVTLALRGNAARGEPHGKAPFGYRRTYHPRTRRVLDQVPDTDEFWIDADGERKPRRDANGEPWSPAGLVRDLFRRAADGEGLRTLAESLNGRGIPTPRQLAAAETGTPLGPDRWDSLRWSAKHLKYMLTNPAYVGRRVFRGEDIGPADWEPLVAEDVFNTVTDLLLDATRQTFAKGRDPRHLLSALGVGSCGKCGATLHAAPANTQYRTRTYKCRSRSACAAVNADAADQLVTMHVLTYLTEPGRIDAILDYLAASNTAALEARQRAKDLRRELETLRAEVAKMVAKPGAAQRAVTAMLTETALLEQIDKAEAEAVGGVAANAALSKFAGADLAEAVAVWKGLPLADRQELIRAVFDVRIVPAGKGRRVPIAQRLTIAERLEL